MDVWMNGYYRLSCYIREVFWEVTGPEALMIYTFVFVLYTCFVFIFAYFLGHIEGWPIWGHGSARPLVSKIGSLGVTLERMFHRTVQSERESKRRLGQGSVWPCHSPGDLLVPRGLPEQHHTLARWQMPSFLPRWASEERPHLTHLWAVPADQGVLNPCEQKYCQIKLRSMAKESLEKLSLITQRALH